MIIYGKTHMDFPASDTVTLVQVQRYDPFGAATFVAYSLPDHTPLEAAECPLHSAHPPYVEFFVDAGTAFRVQSLDNDIVVHYYYPA